MKRIRLAKLSAFLCVCFLSISAFASVEKCEALGNLAATMHKYRATENEVMTLEKMRQKASPVDYSFIKLFAGIAYNPKILNSSYVATVSTPFCSRIVAAISKPASPTKESTFCGSMGGYAKVINTFRKSGDTEIAIKQSFAENLKGGSSYADRLLVDYLSLLVDLRFSPAFRESSDENFYAFSGRACQAFEALTRDLDKTLKKSQ